MIYFNIIYIVLIGLALFLIGRSVYDYKKSSVGVLFIYFLNGVLLLGLIRLFFYFVDSGVIKIEEITLMFFWHVMFYIAIGLFLIAARALVLVVNQVGNEESLVKAIMVFSVTIVIFVTLFLLAGPSNEFLEHNLERTFWDTSGFFHFVAFIFAGLVSFYLLKIHQKFEGNIKSIAFPMLFSIGTLAIIHLWELLTESWKVIHLEGEVGEIVEMFLWIPVYFFIAYAFWKFRKVSKIKS